MFSTDFHPSYADNIVILWANTENTNWNNRGLSRGCVIAQNSGNLLTHDVAKEHLFVAKRTKLNAGNLLSAIRIRCMQIKLTEERNFSYTHYPWKPSAHLKRIHKHQLFANWVGTTHNSCKRMGSHISQYWQVRTDCPRWLAAFRQDGTQMSGKQWTIQNHITEMLNFPKQLRF